MLSYMETATFYIVKRSMKYTVEAHIFNGSKYHVFKPSKISLAFNFVIP